MIAVGLGLAIISIVIFGVFFYKPTLTVIPTPGDATVTLDGQIITGGVPLKLAPGSYTISVSAPNYLTTKVKINLGISEIVNLPIELRQIPVASALIGGVTFPALTTDQKRIVYLGREGKQFFSVDTTLGADGKPQVTAITPERFAGIARVVWSPDRALAIIQTTDGATKLFDFQRYDFLHQEERTLENNWRSVTWHPSEPILIAFRSTPDGERSLVKYTIRTGATERLIDLRDQGLTDPKLAWSPDGRSVAIIENRIILYDVATRRLTTLPEVTGATNAVWSPTSQHLLVEKDGQLTVIPLSGSTLNLGTIRTNLRKAAWTADGSALIIATSADQTIDNLEKITLTDGHRTTFGYFSDHPISADNLMPNNNTTKLWLTSNGTLNSLVLEPEVLELEIK